MDVDTALRTRGSTRAFLPRPVAPATVTAILEQARFAPSGSNIQPWRVHVVSGAARDALCRAVGDAAARDGARPAWPYQYYPAVWREPYLARRRACGWGLYSVLGIAKGDRDAMRTQELRNYELFGAPVGLFFFIDADLGPGSWLDYGMFLQSVMLAAVAHGLATCPQASWAPFHGIIRAQLAVPDTQLLICGIGLGYADPAAPVNRFRPERLAVDEFTRWHDGGVGA
ncbi:MAG TPA: nitroreductase [Steroidobacteraceae bacterium]|nr:nitroreductase [Steroidobacteraceae bacterium]